MNRTYPTLILLFSHSLLYGQNQPSETLQVIPGNTKNFHHEKGMNLHLPPEFNPGSLLVGIDDNIRDSMRMPEQYTVKKNVLEEDVQLDSILAFHWYDSVWVPSWVLGEDEGFRGPPRKVFYYDASENIIVETYFVWDTNTNNWIGYVKDEYTYDASGNMTLNIRYAWDENIDNWIEYWKIEISYDVSGNITFNAFFFWDPITND